MRVGCSSKPRGGGGGLRADGLILSVDKPHGWSSFDVVNKLRGALRWKAVGHAGTLDPPATGLLIILCGGCTRRSREFMSLPKQYRATIRFGVETATDDLDGEITAQREIELWERDRIAAALTLFQGTIDQIPPVISAVKIGGRRSYALARSGKAPDLKARSVQVYSLRLLSEQPPEIDVEISCSRGTYIRAIARDVGRRLGWGGALAQLRRTAIGPYHVDAALSLDAVLRRRAELGCE